MATDTPNRMETRSGRTLLPGGRRRTLFLAGTLGAVAFAAHRRRSRRVVNVLTDPCGPDGLLMPEGDHEVLTTDDGARLATLVVGPTNGPTVVLAHCWMGGKVLWGAVARRLVDSGCRVVLWDQRGHGDSTLGDEPLSIARLGDDLYQILNDLDLRDVVLTGHSMGGMTIQAFAEKHADTFNERVRGVALVATAAQPGWLRVPGPVARALLGDQRTPWLAKQAAKSNGASTDSHAHPDSVRAMNEAMLATTGAARAGFLTAIGQMDLRPGLANIQVPTTIIVGTSDWLTPPARARALHAGIANSELIVLDGYAHMLPYEAPDTIVSVVHSLLEHAATDPEHVTEAQE